MTVEKFKSIIAEHEDLKTRLQMFIKTAYPTLDPETSTFAFEMNADETIGVSWEESGRCGEPDYMGYRIPLGFFLNPNGVKLWHEDEEIKRVERAKKIQEEREREAKERLAREEARERARYEELKKKFG